MNSDDEATSLEEALIYDNRGDLRRRYGLNSFLAVYECAVIDWGDDAESLRERVKRSLSDGVFVGPVPVVANSSVASCISTHKNAAMLSTITGYL